MRPSLRKAEYGQLVADLSTLLEQARRRTVRTVNAMMTTVYWEMGRRIVEFEQAGKRRAAYGQELLERLSEDLTKQFGRGFSRYNLARFRDFYLAFPPERIRATLSRESQSTIFPVFPGDWRHEHG